MNISEELRKNKERHDLEIQSLKLHSDMALEKDELRNTLELQKDESRGRIEMQRLKRKNELALKKAHFKKEQALIEEEVFRVNIRAKQNKATITAGKILRFISFCAFVGSTTLTLRGGIELYTNDSLSAIGFILTTLVLQGAVFVCSMQETSIKENFYKHVTSLLFLKYASLVVSVYHSFQFYKVDDSDFLGLAINGLMCVVLDFITIFGTAISADQITLNFHNKKQLEELTADGKSLNSELELDFEADKNKVVSCEVESLGIKKVVGCEEVKENKMVKNFLDYINEYHKGKRKLPSQKELAKKLDLTQNEVSKIESVLENRGILKMKPNGTYWV